MEAARVGRSGRLGCLGLAREERFELLQARFLLGEELLLLVELGALPVRQSAERPDLGGLSRQLALLPH